MPWEELCLRRNYACPWVMPPDELCQKKKTKKQEDTKRNNTNNERYKNNDNDTKGNIFIITNVE